MRGPRIKGNKEKYHMRRDVEAVDEEEERERARLRNVEAAREAEARKERKRRKAEQKARTQKTRAAATKEDEKAAKEPAAPVRSSPLCIAQFCTCSFGTRESQQGDWLIRKIDSAKTRQHQASSTLHRLMMDSLLCLRDFSG